MEFENMSFFDDQPDEQKIQSVQKSVVPRQNFRSLVQLREPRREVEGDQKKRTILMERDFMINYLVKL